MCVRSLTSKGIFSIFLVFKEDLTTNSSRIYQDGLLLLRIVHRGKPMSVYLYIGAGYPGIMGVCQRQLNLRMDSAAPSQ